MAKARKAIPEWQRLITRCQRLWAAYDKAPTKANLEKFGAHLEKMKASKSVKVKAEAARGARAFRQQWKAAGYHMAAKNKAKNKAYKTKAALRKQNPGCDEMYELRIEDEDYKVIGHRYYADEELARSVAQALQREGTQGNRRHHIEGQKWKGLYSSSVLEPAGSFGSWRVWTVTNPKPLRRKNPADLNKKEMAAIYFTRKGTSRSSFIKKFSEQLYDSLVKKGYLRQKKGGPTSVLDLTEKGYDVKRAMLEDLYQETSEETTWSEVTDDPIGLENQFGGRSTDARSRESHMQPWDNPKGKTEKRKPAKRKPAKRKPAKRKTSVRRKNAGMPGYYKDLARSNRDALVVGLTNDGLFSVNKRTMRTLVKHGLAEVDEEFPRGANMRLTPAGRVAAITIAENRYHGIEEGELSPSLLIKMGWPQHNPAGRRVAITQDELADTIASRLHRAGREVTMVSVGEWLEAFRYEDHFGSGIRSAANRINGDNQSRFIAKVRKAMRAQLRNPGNAKKRAAKKEAPGTLVRGKSRQTDFQRMKRPYLPGEKAFIEDLNAQMMKLDPDDRAAFAAYAAEELKYFREGAHFTPEM